MIRAALVCLGSFAILATTDAAALVIASAEYSTVQTCLTADFTGSRGFHVLVHDNYDRPLPLAYVVIDLTSCPTARFCPAACTGCIVSPDGSSALLLTDSRGIVDFDPRIAGVCDTARVGIYADGVLLARRALATPDHDGDGVVTPADIEAIHALAGTADPTADFDCSGVVDAADEAFVALSVRTACDQPVPVRAHSWGALKLRYR